MNKDVEKDEELRADCAEMEGALGAYEYMKRLWWKDRRKGLVITLKHWKDYELPTKNSLSLTSNLEALLVHCLIEIPWENLQCQKKRLLKVWMICCLLETTTILEVLAILA